MLEEDSSERDRAWSCCFHGPWKGKEPLLPSGCKIGSSKGYQTSQKRDEDGVWYLCVFLILVDCTVDIVNYEFFNSSLIVNPPPFLNKSDRISVVK